MTIILGELIWEILGCYIREMIGMMGERNKAKNEAKIVMDKNTGATVSRKVDLNPKGCSRFKDGHKDMSVVQAMIYLKLRKEGCDQKSALSFGGRSICRSDSTKKIDGPPNFRVLRIKEKKERTITNNVCEHFISGMDKR